MPEFTDKQLARIDSVYNHVVDLCDFLTDGAFDKSDLKTYGPLADVVADYLSAAGYRVNFPTHLVDETHGEDYISDYYGGE